MLLLCVQNINMQSEEVRISKTTTIWVLDVIFELNLMLYK